MANKELQLPLSDVKIINLPKVGQFYTKAEVDSAISGGGTDSQDWAVML